MTSKDGLTSTQIIPSAPSAPNSSADAPTFSSERKRKSSLKSANSNDAGLKPGKSRKSTEGGGSRTESLVDGPKKKRKVSQTQSKTAEAGPSPSALTTSSSNTGAEPPIDDDSQSHSKASKKKSKKSPKDPSNLKQSNSKKKRKPVQHPTGKRSSFISASEKISSEFKDRPKFIPRYFAPNDSGEAEAEKFFAGLSVMKDKSKAEKNGRQRHHGKMKKEKELVIFD